MLKKVIALQMDRVPNEVWGRIFGFLDIQSLARAMCVCRSWQEVIKTDVSGAHLDFSVLSHKLFENNISLDGVVSFLEKIRSSGITYINLSGWLNEGIADGVVLESGEDSELVINLDIPNLCGRLKVIGKTLNHLVLSDYTHIFFASTITNAQLEEIIKCCPVLETLNLNGCPVETVEQALLLCPNTIIFHEYIDSIKRRLF